jgi:hypothetical protein
MVFASGSGAARLYSKRVLGVKMEIAVERVD